MACNILTALRGAVLAALLGAAVSANAATEDELARLAGGNAKCAAYAGNFTGGGQFRHLAAGYAAYRGVAASVVGDQASVIGASRAEGAAFYFEKLVEGQEATVRDELYNATKRIPDADFERRQKAREAVAQAK